MIDIHSLAQPFASWNALYSHSKAVSTTVLTIHLGAMFLGGGLAVAADRATLRVSGDQPEERARQLAEISNTHRPVLIGITVLFVSGVAMALADLENFLGNPVFYVKLGLVALLLVNGALLQKTEAGLRNSPGSTDAPAKWKRMRTFTVLSLTLWIATFVAGSILANAT